MKTLIFAAMALSSMIGSSAEIKVEKLASDIYRVRVAQDGKFGESCLNRYGIVREMPVISSGEDLGVLKVVPKIEAGANGGFTLRFPLKMDSAVYGLCDVCRTNVNRRGATYEMWVKNVKSYIPVPMAITTEGWGVFVNTTYRNFFDVGEQNKDALTVTAAEGALDFYFFTGRDLGALLDAYTRITGRPTMLPIWGYAFTYVCN